MSWDNPIDDVDTGSIQQLGLIEQIKRKLQQVISEPTDTGDVVAAVNEVADLLKVQSQFDEIGSVERIPFQFNTALEGDGTLTTLVPAMPHYQIVVTNIVAIVTHYWADEPPAHRPVLPSHIEVRDNQAATVTDRFYVRLVVYPGYPGIIIFNHPKRCRESYSLRVVSEPSNLYFGQTYALASNKSHVTIDGYYESADIRRNP